MLTSKSTASYKPTATHLATGRPANIAAHQTPKSFVMAAVAVPLLVDIVQFQLT